MANRWKGNFVVAAATTSSGTDYTGKANGAWGLNNQLQQKQSGLWAKGVGVPSTPTIGTATGGDSQATVVFTASSDTGGGVITTYTATSTPGNIVGTASTSPIIVTGLTNGTAYTFKVRATNSLGYTSNESAASNSVIPQPLAPTSYLAISGNTTTPNMAVYPWSSTAGAGPKYSDPSTLTTGATNIAFNTFQAIANSLFVGSFNSPFINGYTWTGDGVGFGSKFANPSTLPGNTVRDLDINTAGNCLAVTFNTTVPFINVYSINASGFSNLFTNGVGTSGINSITSVGFNTIDTLIAVGGYTTGFASLIYVYNWSNSTGYGSKYANPSSLPGDAPRSIVFNNSNNAIFIGRDNANGLEAYAWSGGFGTKYASPASNPTGDVKQVSWDNTNSRIAAAQQSSPYINVYAWSGSGFGTKLADPTTLPSAAALGLSFNYSNNTIAIPLVSSVPAIYAWSSSGFGTQYSSISGAPYGNSYGRVSFTGV